MFLTQMKLNPSRRGTAFLLASHQRLHAAVLCAFPEAAQDNRVLWRIDRNSPHDLRLLISSASAPDLTHLIEQAGWPTRPDATWDTRDYDGFLGRLSTGQQWRFRLRANPVVRRRDADGRIHTIPLTLNQAAGWVSSRSQEWGFAIATTSSDDEATPQVAISERSSLSFTRRSASAETGRQVTIASAQFDGHLKITDANLFRQSLVQGMGRAKAYGCGLMTLTTPTP